MPFRHKQRSDAPQRRPRRRQPDRRPTSTPGQTDTVATLLRFAYVWHATEPDRSVTLSDSTRT
ncbi:MAG: hypothetical protein R2699_06015 [Acidimicrobiales bacterium]